MNCFVIEPTKFEQGLLFDEILKTILENRFTTWKEVIQLYAGQPEYILLLSSRPSIVTELLKDIWREKNPDGKVQRVQLINKKDEV